MKIYHVGVEGEEEKCAEVNNEAQEWDDVRLCREVEEEEAR